MSVHINCFWSAKEDANRRYWRVYHSRYGDAKGKLRAELDPEDDEYLIRDVVEGEHWVTILSVNHLGIEQDWQSTEAREKIVITRSGHKATDPTTSSAGGAVAGTQVSVKATLDPPAQGDPPVQVEVVKGPDADRGQIVGRADVERDGITGDGGETSVTADMPASPGRGTGGARQTYALRLTTKAGKHPTAGVTFSAPAMDWPNHEKVTIASIVGDSLSGFSSPADTDAYEIDSTDGVRLKEYPAASAMTAGSGWGTANSGRFSAEKYGCMYMTACTVRSQIVDTNKTAPMVLDCYDEVQRKSATSGLTGLATSLLPYPYGPEADPEWSRKDIGPSWAARVLTAEGKSIQPVPRTKWWFRVGATTSALTASPWSRYSPNQLVVGPYVQVKFVVREPLGLHQLISPRVYVRGWIPWSEGSVPVGNLPTGTGASDVAIGAAVTPRHLAVSMVSGSRTLDRTYDVVLVSGDYTVTLPDPSGITDGRVYHIHKMDVSAVGAVVTSVTGTIDGVSAITLGTVHDRISVVNYSGNWFTLGTEIA